MDGLIIDSQGNLYGAAEYGSPPTLASFSRTLRNCSRCI